MAGGEGREGGKGGEGSSIMGTKVTHHVSTQHDE